MATAKSIIVIDVDDLAWKAFDAQFQKWSKLAKSSSADVAAVGDAAKSAADRYKKAIDQQVASFKKAQDGDLNLRKQATATAKMIAKGLGDSTKAFVANLEKSSPQFSRMAQFSKVISANMGDASRLSKMVAENAISTTFQAAKWAAFGAIGGGFGLGALAGNASDARRQAQGLGVSTGELRAANTNYSKYFDPAAVMGNIASAQSSYGSSWKLGGINGNNPAEALPAVIARAVAEFRGSGGKQEGYAARGMADIMPFEDARRLASLSAQELQATIAQAQRDRRDLAVGDSVSQQWQDFKVTMDRTGQSIETALIKGLVPLAPQLSKLSESLAKVISTFLGSDKLKVWLGNLGEQIKGFAEYLGSDKFQTSIRDWVDSLDNLFGNIKRIAHYLGLYQTKEERLVSGTEDEQLARRRSMPGTIDGVGANGAAVKSALDRSGFFGSGWQAPNHNPGNLRNVGGSGFQSFSSDEEGLRKMAWQLRRYQDAYKLDNIEQIVSRYAPSNENDTKSYIKNVAKRTGFAPSEKLDLHDSSTMAALISAMTKQENSRSNYTPQGVKVVIENATGGSAQASVAAMAPVR